MAIESDIKEISTKIDENRALREVDRDHLINIKDSIAKIEVNQNGHNHADDIRFEEINTKLDVIPKDVADYVADRLNTYTLNLSDHVAQDIQGAVKNALSDRDDKIDKLTEIIKAHIEASKPSMVFISDIQSANKVIQYIAKMVGVFGVIITSMWALVHYLKN